MNKTISLIIPTYNERDNITPLLKRLENALSSYDYEIVFIDDNSADGTAELATSLSYKYPVKVIVRKDKRGLASAVVDGLKYVSGDIIAVMDADLQHPPEVISDLLREIEKGADIVIASRYVPGGGCQGWSLTRRLISRGAIFLAHLLLPATRQISDPMSGFFMFNKRVVRDAELKPTGYKILLEILMVGKFQSIAEVPYTFSPREGGKSKLNIQQQLAYLRHIYSLMRRKGELARFIRFCLVGGSGVGVDEGMFYLLSGVLRLKPVELASALSAETAIITNFILNDIFTFRDRRSPGMKAMLKRFWKFNLFCLAGVGIKVGIVSLLFNIAGVHELLANLIGIAVAMLWNYFLNNWWTWRP